MKNTIALLFALIMAIAFTGCASPATPASETDHQEQAAKPTETASEAPMQTAFEEPTEIPAPTAAPLPESPEQIGDCVKDAEVLLHMPYSLYNESPDGTPVFIGGEDGDGYVCVLAPEEHGERDFYLGPTGFAVSAGRIFVLDTYKSRVVVWDGEGFDYISIANPEKSFPTQISVIGDAIYLGYSPSRKGTKIISFDMNGSMIEDHGFPEESESGLYLLFAENGRPAVLNHDLVCYELVDGEFVRSYSIGVDPVAEPIFTASVDDGREFKINAGSNTIAGVERVIDNRLYCVAYEFNPQVSELDMEISYRVYDTEGALLGATAVNKNEALTTESDICVSPEGELYMMVCMKDGLYVTKPNLRLEYASHLPHSDSD